MTYLIPMIYVTAAFVAGLTLPRIELTYFPYNFGGLHPNSALVTLGAISSGMMSLTAIIFSIAYITVQFNAIAYSPRLALWFASNPRVFHALGVFIATFVYSLWMMAWIDRGGNGFRPARILYGGHDPFDRQHICLHLADPRFIGPADHQYAAPAWDQGPAVIVEIYSSAD